VPLKLPPDNGRYIFLDSVTIVIYDDQITIVIYYLYITDVVSGQARLLAYLL